ncbi:hypothetical protein [Streptomyces sp. NPDC047071]
MAAGFEGVRAVACACTRRRFGFPSGYGAGPDNHRPAEAVTRAAKGR